MVTSTTPSVSGEVDVAAVGASIKFGNATATEGGKDITVQPSEVRRQEIIHMSGAQDLQLLHSTGKGNSAISIRNQAVSGGSLKRRLDEELPRDRHHRDGNEHGSSTNDDIERIRQQFSNDGHLQQQHKQQTTAAAAATVASGNAIGSESIDKQQHSTAAAAAAAAAIASGNANGSESIDSNIATSINDNNISNPNSTTATGNINRNYVINNNNLSTTSSSPKATTSTMPFTDIYGRIPGKEPKFTIPCPNDNCSRHLASSRLALHLEKCLGLVSSSRRGSNASKQSAAAAAVATKATAVAMTTTTSKAISPASKSNGGNKKLPGKQAKRRNSKAK